MPDNEEIQGVKFSEFPSATPGNSDEVVGLHSGDNARFSVANFVQAIRQGLANIFVPVTREVNGHALSSDITLDASDVGAVDADDVGVAGGVAELDANGKVPNAQLPPISAEGKADQDTIAPVEDSTTATEAHPLGSIFYLNGVLYRALADIAIGGTINTGAGGNATQTSVALNFKRVVTLTSAQYTALSAAEKAADIVYIVTDKPMPEISTSTPNMDGIGAAGSTGGVSDAGHVHPSDTSKADKTDLSSIQATGSTNATGAAIAAGTYFYLNGELVQAIGSGVASGAAFTLNTNYKTVTAGGLNELKAIEFHEISLPAGIVNSTNAKSGYYKLPDGRIKVYVCVVGITANTFTTLATLPSGFRPAGPNSSCAMGSDAVTVGWDKGQLLYVGPDGTINVLSTSTYCQGLSVDFYPA